ncbi:MAG: glutamine-hydrolyzing carbamoyl-phosphate synthase small subunit [Leptospirales bacterium]|nr:glutamine-hydrolyzing carbamoyl-phosphate synthase small subunit [Leptospirales bacterium]
MKKKAILVLENGQRYHGFSFGAEVESMGEVCFNTSMTGYQEILTDPSYKKQIVTLTYPMIGNYGIDPDVAQSSGIKASGLIVKEYVQIPSNFTSKQTLSSYLKENNVPGLQGIDTRKLVLTLRNEGAMRGGIFVDQADSQELLNRVKSIPSMAGLDLAREVSTSKAYKFGTHKNDKFSIGVLDYGVKTGILRLLDQHGFNVTVYPAQTSYAELKTAGHVCYFLSNGPGDPEPLGYAIETAKAIIADGKPIFGICLGHQVLGLAGGRKTYKLKFGHRGGNQPVKNLENGRVEITAQNHGFAVEEDKASQGLALSRVNLNDQTVEGFADAARNILSVQYHPEACPGPHDAEYLFREFHEMVKAAS